MDEIERELLLMDMAEEAAQYDNKPNLYDDFPHWFKVYTGGYACTLDKYLEAREIFINFTKFQPLEGECLRDRIKRFCAQI